MGINCWCEYYFFHTAISRCWPTLSVRRHPLTLIRFWEIWELQQSFSELEGKVMTILRTLSDTFIQLESIAETDFEEWFMFSLQYLVYCPKSSLPIIFVGENLHVVLGEDWGHSSYRIICYLYPMLVYLTADSQRPHHLLTMLGNVIFSFFKAVARIFSAKKDNQL